MIPSRIILSIGPKYIPPKGGIAQCVYLYRKYIYKDFRYISNSCDGNKLSKAITFCYSLIKFQITLLICREISIVHIHTASYNSFRRSARFINLAKKTGRKVILHIHGGGFKDYYNKEKAFINPVLQKCNAIITLSESWKSFFLNTICIKNVYVVPNIIESPDINKVTDTLFHLLYMGHIMKPKGIFDLVELFNEHKNEYSGKLILDIAGGMYEEKRLKKYIKSNNLDNIIHFHGWVESNYKIKLLNLADAFILPSYIEGVPISILEAESYGLPIVSTRVGGIPEIVSHGVNGYLFSPGNKQEMKQYIDNLLLMDIEKRIIMGKHSKEMVYRNLPSNIISCLEEVYNSL